MGLQGYDDRRQKGHSAKNWHHGGRGERQRGGLVQEYRLWETSHQVGVKESENEGALAEERVGAPPGEQQSSHSVTTKSTIARQTNNKGGRKKNLCAGRERPLGRVK